MLESWKIWYERTLFPAQYLIGHRQITDAFLISLARKNKGRLATLDQGIAAFLPAKEAKNTVTLIVP